MAISFVGVATGAGTTITIPGSYQTGDIIFMLAWRNSSTTIPTLPAGWITLGSQGSAASGYRLGWKLAQSSSDTSGTWTNATHLVCSVYRGQATNKSPLAGLDVTNKISNGNSVPLFAGTSWSPIQKGNRSNWIIAFAASVSSTNVNQAPTGMTLRSNATITSVMASDTNGPWPTTTGYPNASYGVNAISGTVGLLVELLAEEISLQNYMGIGVGSGMSTTEKIR